MRAVSNLLAALSLVGCASSLELSVDLRSDLAPGTEVVAADVTVTDVQGALVERASRALGPGDDLVAGRRLLDLEGLGPGTYVIRVGLRSATEEVLGASRFVTLTDADLAVTLVLSRRCAGVRCPEDAQCVEGECVPRCAPTQLGECPPPACVVDDDCPPLGGCYRARCALRRCLYAPSAACDGGAVDASPPEAGPRDGGPRDGGRRDDATVDAGCLAEERCDNGVDDDCDGATDCADPSCAGEACADDGEPCTEDRCEAGACAHAARPDGDLVAGGPRRCCDGAATDVTTDRQNCGACGQRCDPGFDCTTARGPPTCDCRDANSQCHGGAGWVCSTTYFVCACLPGQGACPGAAECVDDPMGPNFCEYP